MIEKGPLEALLQAWKAPSPRGDFEDAVLRRLRSQPAQESFWRRWFVEPLELGRSQAFAAAGSAVLALVIGFVAFHLPNESSRPSVPSPQPSLGLNAFSTFPEGSVTTAYWEMVQR